MDVIQQNYDPSQFYRELGPIVKRSKEQDILKDTGLSKATIWRWENGVNLKYPEPDKALRLLKAESGKNTIPSIAKHYGGKIEDYLSKAYPNQFSIAAKDCYTIEEKIANIKDPYAFLAMKYCEKEGGIVRESLELLLAELLMRKSELVDEKDCNDEMVNSFLPIIKPKIIKMINDGLIIELENNMLQAAVMDFWWNLDSCKSFINTSLNFIDGKSITDGVTQYFELFKYTTDEAAHRVSRVMFEAFNEAAEIMKDNPGNIPIQLNEFIAVLDPRTIDELSMETEKKQ